MYLKRGAMRLARQFAKQILDEGLPLAGSGNIAYPFGVSAHIKRKKERRKSALPIGIFKNINFYRIELSNDARNPSVQYPWDFSLQ